MTTTVLNGQSNYDLALKLYGSIDMLIKLCKDNNVTDLDVISGSVYISDERLILDRNVTGYNYATKPL